MRFAGQQVVITGAAGVYGRGLAEAFAQEGAHLLLSDGDAAALAALANALPPGHAVLHPADLTDDAALDGLIAAATGNGAPQVLINNAGIYPFIPLMEVTGAEWDRIISVNTRAPFRLMQGIGRAMAAAGRGAIVNVTSAAAEVHRGNGVPYGASKCALEYLTRAFALELGPSGVRVNSARPGFAEGSAGNPMPAGYAEAIRARSLLGALGTPADFAAGVMFLCSEDARFMTGAVLDCGGGGHINRRAGAATAARGRNAVLKRKDSMMDQIRAELSPTGVLRAGINMGNFLLVTSRAENGDPAGVSPSMARAIADALGVAVQYVPFARPGDLADAVDSNVWDIGLIGAEPQRAEKIAFTAAYAEIEATYMVPPGSPITKMEDVDRPGNRIAVTARAAYDLWLERNIHQAKLIRSATLDAAFEQFAAEKLEVLAGLRPKLLSDIEKMPGARILDGKFTAVQQAIGTSRRNSAAAVFLAEFVEKAKASGLVARFIAEHKVRGLSVAPPA